MKTSIRMKRICTFFAGVLLASVVTLTGAAAEANDSTHEYAYAKALERLEAVPDKMLEAMRRIRTGEVSHFDYLQYEHIELLRDAKAVHFPPMSLAESKRELVRDQADRVLKFAVELEVNIADFLRAQALLNGSLLGTLDIANAAGKLTESTSQQMALIDLSEAVRQYQATFDSSDLQSVLQAFDRVDGSGLDRRYKLELSAQRQIIANNDQVAGAAMESMGTAQLSVAIAQLINLYEGSETIMAHRHAYNN